MAENIDTDVIAYINVTNPLLKDETIVAAIEKNYKTFRGKYDSLNSAHLIKEFLFKDNLPINHDLRHQPRSQDLSGYRCAEFCDKHY